MFLSNVSDKCCDWYDSDVDATLLMLKSEKKPCLFYFFTILFYIFYISWLLVGWWWWAAGALEALQVPTRDPESLPPGVKTKLSRNIFFVIWLTDFNLLFDWHSRSKVETYICQKVEDSWIYNLGGGNLYILVEWYNIQVIIWISCEYLSDSSPIIIYTCH